jgi:hypothetical protein
MYIAAGMVMALKWRDQKLLQVILVGIGMSVNAVVACLNLYLIGYQIYECARDGVSNRGRNSREADSLSRIYPMVKI